MTAERNETCPTDEIDPSSGFVKAFSGALLLLFAATFVVLTTLFVRYKGSSGVLSSRANIMTYSYVFGTLIQMCWAIDSLMNRTGFPCVILDNLLYFVIGFQLIPRVISAVQIYFKVKVNKELAKFELVSAVHLRGYHGFSKTLEIDDRNNSKPWNPFRCDFIDHFFRERRKERAHKEIYKLSSRFPAFQASEDLPVALEHFPSHYALFFSSKNFAVNLQIIALVALIIAFAATAADEIGCLSPCQEELEMLPDILFITIFVAPLAGIALYEIRNEPDPLGLVKEIYMILLLVALFGTPAITLGLIQPGSIEEEGRFRWALLWAFESWLELIVSLGFPLYLARRNWIYKKTHFSEVSLEKVLESEIGRDQFKAFLVGELSVENYMFWRSGTEYKEKFSERDEAENSVLRRIIADLYIVEGARFCVNVSGVVREVTTESLNNPPKPTDFDDALTGAVAIMQSDAFLRFRRTSEFNRLFGDEEERFI